MILKITKLKTPLNLEKDIIEKIEKKVKNYYLLSYLLLFIFVLVYALILTNIEEVYKTKDILINSVVFYLLLGFFNLFYAVANGDMGFRGNVLYYPIHFFDKVLYILGNYIKVYEHVEGKNKCIIKINLKQYFYKNNKLHSSDIEKPAIIKYKMQEPLAGEFYVGEYYINGNKINILDGEEWDKKVEKYKKKDKIKNF